MSDTPISDIDSKNKMALVWTILNWILRIPQFVEVVILARIRWTSHLDKSRLLKLLTIT